MWMGKEKALKVFKLDHPVSMIAAPLIWAVHFVICYLLVSLACLLGWNQLRPGINPADIGIAVVTLAALILLGLIAVMNYEKYRDFPGDGSSGDDMSCFFALNSILLCGISTVALIWVAFPVMMLPTCVI